MAKSPSTSAHRSLDVTECIADAKEGSGEALGQLLEYCRDYLLLVANRELDPALRAKGGASDVVQEAFLHAQCKFPQFRGQSEAELLAWLRRILLNNLSNFERALRTNKRAASREVPLAGDSSDGRLAPAAGTLSPSGHVIAREDVQALQQALADLPPHYAQVIDLRNWQRCSFAEIGNAMDCSAEAARKLWSRAVEQLRQQIGDARPPAERGAEATRE